MICFFTAENQVDQIYKSVVFFNHVNPEESRSPYWWKKSGTFLYNVIHAVMNKTWTDQRGVVGGGRPPPFNIPAPLRTICDMETNEGEF